MIDKGALRVFSMHVNFAHFAGWFPYHYSKGQMLFNNTQRYWKRLKINLFMITVYELFLIFRTIQTWKKKDVTETEKIKSLSITIVYLAVFMCHLITFSNYGDQKKILNAIFDTSKIFSGDGKVEKTTRKHLTVFMISHAFAAVSRALTVFSKPESEELFSSLAPNPRKLPFVVKLVISLIHLNIGGFHIFVLLIYGSIHVIYVAGILPIIKQMNVSEDEEITPGQAATFSKWHHHLVVLQNNFTSVFGTFPFTAEVCTLFLAILNLFIAVMFLDTRSAFRGLLPITCTTLLFSRLALVHEASEETLESWKRNRGMNCPLWFQKYKKSTKSIRVDVASFFYIDRALVVTLWSIIIDQTVSLILTFRGS